jgi:hypothetical protein
MNNYIECLINGNCPNDIWGFLITIIIGAIARWIEKRNDRKNIAKKLNRKFPHIFSTARSAEYFMKTKFPDENLKKS